MEPAVFSFQDFLRSVRTLFGIGFRIQCSSFRTIPEEPPQTPGSMQNAARTGYPDAMTKKQELRTLQRKLNYINRAIAALEVLETPHRKERRSGVKASCPVIPINSLRGAIPWNLETPKRPPIAPRATIIAFPVRRTRGQRQRRAEFLAVGD